MLLSISWAYGFFFNSILWQSLSGWFIYPFLILKYYFHSVIHMPWQVCGVQMTDYGYWFSPPNTWVRGLNSGPQVWQQAPFPTEPSWRPALWVLISLFRWLPQSAESCFVYSLISVVFRVREREAHIHTSVTGHKPWGWVCTLGHSSLPTPFKLSSHFLILLLSGKHVCPWSWLLIDF